MYLVSGVKTSDEWEETVMRVFVAGGTGALGRRLVPQLVARGHEVTATTRRNRAWATTCAP
jgi:putative NADH-flavin reductase